MLLARTSGYLDYKNVIKKEFEKCDMNLKNVLLCLIFTDPVT